MDRVKKKMQNIKAKDLAWPVLIVGLILGIVVVCFGAAKVYDLNNQLGTKDLDEINTSISELAKEYQEAVVEEHAEYDSNGLSDKYIELNKKSTELSKEITKLTNSRYMRETGYNNPNSIWKILELAPMLWIGAVIATASVFAFAMMRKK